MRETIIGIIAEVLGVDQETVLHRFSDKDVWDSLLRVEVLFAIEDEFHIQFTEEELAAMTTPAKLCEIVAGKADEG